MKQVIREVIGGSWSVEQWLSQSRFLTKSWKTEQDLYECWALGEVPAVRSLQGRMRRALGRPPSKSPLHWLLFLIYLEWPFEEIPVKSSFIFKIRNQTHNPIINWNLFSIGSVVDRYSYMHLVKIQIIFMDTVMKCYLKYVSNFSLLPLIMTDCSLPSFFLSFFY